MKQQILTIAIIFLAIITLGCPSPGSTDDINYNITINPEGADGSEKISSNVNSTTEGTKVTLTATIETGRKVTLTANGIAFTPSVITTSGNTSTFTMPASDVEIKAVFENIPPSNYNITITPEGAEGSEEISRSVSSTTEGTTVTLTATIEAGRKVSLTASGITFTPSVITTSGNTSTFTMPASDVSINAKFEDIIYNLSVNNSGETNSEAISLSSSTAAKGTEITITASTLGVGRKVTITSPGLTITPAEIITSGSTATFTMPSADVSLTATFADRYQVGDTGPGNGIIFYDDLLGYDFNGDTIIQSDEKDLLDGSNDGTLTTKRYLEAAPSGWNAATAPYDPLCTWHIYGENTGTVSIHTMEPNEFPESVGNGEADSSAIYNLIMNYAYDNESERINTAFYVCENYNGGNQNDWFLPSLGELYLSYKHKDLIGGFSNGNYISSSYCYREPYLYDVVGLDLGNGSKKIDLTTETPYGTRPIRSF